MILLGASKNSMRLPPVRPLCRRRGPKTVVAPSGSAVCGADSLEKGASNKCTASEGEAHANARLERACSERGPPCRRRNQKTDPPSVVQNLGRGGALSPEAQQKVAGEMRARRERLRPICASHRGPVFDRALQLCLGAAHRRSLNNLRRKMVIDPHGAQR